MSNLPEKKKFLFTQSSHLSFFFLKKETHLYTVRISPLKVTRGGLRVRYWAVERERSWQLGFLSRGVTACVWEGVHCHSEGATELLQTENQRNPEIIKWDEAEIDMSEHLGKDVLLEVLSKFPAVVLSNTVNGIQSGANIYDSADTFSFMTPCNRKDMEHERLLERSYFCFALTLSRWTLTCDFTSYCIVSH